MIKRFLNLFDDQELIDFDAEKLPTYFLAAFSVIAGDDVREKLEFWGFEIDDDYYDKIFSKLENKLSD